MTDRLYYQDAYLTRFEARVVEALVHDSRPAAVLDRTAFYPTGGGQPHDTGKLGQARVVDVVEREPGGAVIHVLDAVLPAGIGDAVEGQVDWQRRFDLMQQHTGQHLLSAAFASRLGAKTVGFHLSDEYATIDVDQAPLSAQDLDRVEEVANRVVWEDRPTTARFVPDEELASLVFRKPVTHEGPVRAVEVQDFDRSACGGTHVKAAGEVGVIKITRTERRGGETRIEFLCGQRALADYRAKNALLMGLAAEYTIGHWELGELVHRLADELKDTRYELRRARDALLDAKADTLWRDASPVGPVRVVRAHLQGWTPDDLKHLAQRLIAWPGTVALLGTGQAGEKGFFTFARSDGVEAAMGTLVREACQVIGGRGGGRPEFAQGGGQEGALVGEALHTAEARLREMLSA